jgi:hypothetical protein
MVRGSPVPDSHPSPVYDSPPENSPAAKRIRVPFKLFGAYAVALVNAAAILYILVRLVRAVHRFLEAI